MKEMTLSELPACLYIPRATMAEACPSLCQRTLPNVLLPDDESSTLVAGLEDVGIARVPCNQRLCALGEGFESKLVAYESISSSSSPNLGDFVPAQPPLYLHLSVQMEPKENFDPITQCLCGHHSWRDLFRVLQSRRRTHSCLLRCTRQYVAIE
jgi:hypothetical protein